MAAELDVIYRIAADITGLQDGVNRAATATEGLGTTVRRVGGALSAVFAGLKIKQASTEVIDFADHITDLASKSGLTTAAVQELDYVAKQSGSSFDQVSQALALMGDRLVSGDKSTVGALGTLGLKLEDLRAMAPDQAFEAIASAVAKIEDPMVRSNVAMDLFGRSGVELLPVLTSDISDLRDRAQEMGLVMGTDVVAAGAALDDKMEELDTRIKSMKANALLPLLSTFMDLPQSIQTGGVVMMELLPILASLGTAFALLAGPAGMAAVTTFLTTVLLPILAPAGAIIAAIGGVYLAWKHWDKIVEIAQYVYTGVKTWLIDNLANILLLATGPLLGPVMGVVAVWKNWEVITKIAEGVYLGVKMWMVDKFNAIVESIRAKIDAVTGFFGNMYDKVVGRSFVPDMVAGIAAEFGKLGKVMVDPVKTATDTVSGMFKNLATGLAQGFLGGGTSSAIGAVKGFATQAVGTLVGMIPVVGPFLKGFVGPIMSGLGKIGSAIKGLFGGGEIGQVVNPARDAFFDKYGGLEGVNQGAEAAGDTTFETTKAIFGAKTKAELDRAIEAWLSRTGVPRLAAGGLVTQPTFAMVGESGPELVIPLNDVGQLGIGNRPIVVPVYLDGRKIAQAAARHLPRVVEQWVGG